MTMTRFKVAVIALAGVLLTLTLAAGQPGALSHQTASHPAGPAP